MINSLLFDISIVIIIATLFAYIAKLFKQPLIPAYILTGLIIGPILGLISDQTSISFMSEFGIALMLFIVGLEMNINRLKNVSLISTLGGSLRSIIFFGLSFLIAILLGFIKVDAFYIGIFIAFSSTMVVVKILTDKQQLDTLHGRIIVGMLLMEDVLAIIVLSIISAETISILAITISLLKVLILFALAILGSKFIFPKLFGFAAENIEILLLLSISTLLIFTSLATYLGFILTKLLPFLSPEILSMIKPEISMTIGAFIAGVMLGNLPYHYEIISRVNPLKDFFATIFFVSLGISLVWVKSIFVPLIIFIGIIIIVKPIITLAICGAFGYKKRPSFLISNALSQTSEFALIIALQGFMLGKINQDLLSIAVISTVVTMALSTYAIKYEDYIYKILSKSLFLVDKIAGNRYNLEYLPPPKKKIVILCGYNRIGYSILNTLNEMKKAILVVDYNTEMIRKKVPCLYGDIGESETLDRTNMDKADMIISTVGELEDNLLIISKAKEKKNKTKIFVTATEIDDALKLYEAGADYVILPHFLGGEHASGLIKNFDKHINKMIKVRIDHIKELRHRKALGQVHPTHSVRHQK
jgi:Kef-type K+ transport system membrane component KefB/voltage-gated potassium channel Kch